MSRADELRAELEVAELEELLVAAKESGGPDELNEMKHALREARRKYRTLRAGGDPDVGEGDAVVRPATVQAAAKVEGTG